MSILSLLVFLILIGLAFWVISTLAGAFGIPGPIVTVLYVILVVFVVIYLLQLLGGYSGGPVLRLH